MDFIEQLPLFKGLIDILVIVDHLTKQAVFVPIHKMINIPALAELFIKHIFSKHGTLSHITLDWGPEFFLTFFRSLTKSLNIKLYFTSGHYLEADG